MEDKDPPITPADFISGVKVIDFGEARIARGYTRRPYSSCKHLNLVYDTQERRVWCEDCERNVDPFDAFKILVENYAAAEGKVNRLKQEATEAAKFSIRSRAAKAIDDIWRKRRMVPCCPHCTGPLLPEFFANGVGSTASAEIARRKFGLVTPPEGEAK